MLAFGRLAAEEILAAGAPELEPFRLALRGGCASSRLEEPYPWTSMHYRLHGNAIALEAIT
jgi:hypothetical protein